MYFASFSSSWIKIDTTIMILQMFKVGKSIFLMYYDMTFLSLFVILEVNI